MGLTAVVVGERSVVDDVDESGLLTWYPSIGLVWITEMNPGWMALGVVDMVG
jgi:hypothetical protein